MRLWRTVLLLLLVALAAALAWHWLAADPGYVQVRLRGTTLETSVVVAIAGLLLAWAAIGIELASSAFVNVPLGSVAGLSVAVAAAVSTGVGFSGVGAAVASLALTDGSGGMATGGASTTGGAGWAGSSSGEDAAATVVGLISLHAPRNMRAERASTMVRFIFNSRGSGGPTYGSC